MRSLAWKIKQYLKTIFLPKWHKALKVIKKTEEFKKLSRNHWWIDSCRIIAYNEFYNELKSAIDKSDMWIQNGFPPEFPFRLNVESILKKKAKMKAAIPFLDKQNKYCEMAIAYRCSPEEMGNSESGIIQYFYVDLNKSKVVFSVEGNWVACDFTPLRENN